MWGDGLRCFKLFLISALSAISHHSEWVRNADIGRCSYRLNLDSCPTTRSSLRLVSVLLGHNPPAQMKCWYRVIRLKVALTFADMDSSFKSISINRAFNLYNAVTTILWITDSVSCINYFFLHLLMGYFWAFKELWSFWALLPSLLNHTAHCPWNTWGQVWFQRPLLESVILRNFAPMRSTWNKEGTFEDKGACKDFKITAARLSNMSHTSNAQVFISFPLLKWNYLIW